MIIFFIPAINTPSPIQQAKTRKTIPIRIIYAKGYTKFAGDQEKDADPENDQAPAGVKKGMRESVHSRPSAFPIRYPEPARSLVFHFPRHLKYRPIYRNMVKAVPRPGAKSH
jgi:hypothetical protein